MSNQANPFAFDQSQNDALEEPVQVDLYDPKTDEPLIDDKGRPFWIAVYSAKSKTFRRRAFQIQRRAQKAAKNGAQPLNFEKTEGYQNEIYAAAMADEWRICQRAKDGKLKEINLPCTPENCVTWVEANVLMKPQIVATTDDLAEFLGDDGQGLGNGQSENSES